MPWLINAAQAEKFRKSQKSLVILDASLHMPSENRNPKQEYLDKHITGARFFDIDAFSDHSSDIPHMLTTDETKINKILSELGIRNDYKIIFYDDSHLHSACRALWMMKVFGHNPHLLYILDGGLSAWEKYINKMQEGHSLITSKEYSAKYQPQLIYTLAQMKENLRFPQQQVIDLRHPVRFAGGQEPRPGLRSGHIPGSLCLPFMSLFEKNGTFLPLDKIRRKLINITADLKMPIVSTCGSAITAPILDFILDLLGHKQHTVYDGSWSEWGAEKLYPGEQSLEERPIANCIDLDGAPEID